jgi:SAM-dependent methyltransferase
MDNTAICNKIDEAIKSLMEIKNSISNTVVTTQSVAPITTTDDLGDFESLKKALLSEKWPYAVNPSLICDTNSDSDKKDRGIGIMELLIEEALTKDQKFLDFGCGEGHCVICAPDTIGCGVAVGYDKKNYNWPSVPKTRFTTSFDDVATIGPYDAILIFDVLDHVENETPLNLLKKAKSVLTPEGKIYIRCHPWISRHGTHLYQKLNKAFAHIVFTDEELAQLSDHVADPNTKVVFPLDTYARLFDEAGLKVANERRITEKVEAFFKIPKITERILQNTKHAKFPEFQMSLQFIDYVLTN